MQLAVIYQSHTSVVMAGIIHALTQLVRQVVASPLDIGVPKA